MIEWNSCLDMNEQFSFDSEYLLDATRRCGWDKFLQFSVDATKEFNRLVPCHNWTMQMTEKSRGETARLFRRPPNGGTPSRPGNRAKLSLWWSPTSQLKFAQRIFLPTTRVSAYTTLHFICMVTSVQCLSSVMLQLTEGIIRGLRRGNGSHLCPWTDDSRGARQTVFRTRRRRHRKTVWLRRNSDLRALVRATEGSPGSRRFLLSEQQVQVDTRFEALLLLRDYARPVTCKMLRFFVKYFIFS